MTNLSRQKDALVGLQHDLRPIKQPRSSDKKPNSLHTILNNERSPYQSNKPFRYETKWNNYIFTTEQNSIFFILT